MKRMRRYAMMLLAALALTIGSAWTNPPTDERAMYGLEGPWEQNWRPRMVAGWPAPYLADNPHTSVPHQVGVEDEFRPGAFVATLSFWLLAVLTASKALAWLRQGRRRR